VTAATIIDPDLEQAIEDLQWPVRRIRQIEDQLLDPDSVARYPQLTSMLHERGELRDRLKLKADQLNLDPWALMLLVVEAEKARSKARGRRPVSLDKLLNVVRIVGEYAGRERAELNADLVAVQHLASVAAKRATAAARAVDYLEASRS
jgi:hypothetical protein